MSSALIIPTLGGGQLDRCLGAVRTLSPAPDRVVVVHSGDTVHPTPLPSGIELLRRSGRLGFAAAVNLGVAAVAGSAEEIALLNDDAVPHPSWLGQLSGWLRQDPELGAVQGTITDEAGQKVDGRGVSIDTYGLPVQRDRGAPADIEPAGSQRVVAVSGTAALFRTQALQQARLAREVMLDVSFDSYFEDLDLGLRLRRLGWSSLWVADARCQHLGSITGRRMSWRHPWWLLTNRWRCWAGNLTRRALLTALPRLLRGELRAARTLMRANPRTALVAGPALAAIPWLACAGWRRQTPGPRIDAPPWSLR